MDTATLNPRPDGMTADESEIYDWLEANGITEYLPEHAEVRVDTKAGTLTYTSFVWNDDARRGFNSDIAATCDDLSERVWDIARKAGLGPTVDSKDHREITEMRTVPLRVPPTDRVRRLFAKSGLRLKEARRWR